ASSICATAAVPPLCADRASDGWRRSRAIRKRLTARVAVDKPRSFGGRAANQPCRFVADVGGAAARRLSRNADARSPYQGCTHFEAARCGDGGDFIPQKRMGGRSPTASAPTSHRFLTAPSPPFHFPSLPAPVRSACTRRSTPTDETTRSRDQGPNQ